MRPLGGLGITGRPPSEAPPAAPEVPGLKLRAPLLVGYFITVLTHWGNSQGLGGAATDWSIFQATQTALTPARWGFYAWGAIYAYQGLGAFYALVPHGYGTNGVKERLVRVAGACWPFGWTCLLVWQWCFSQYRMIAAWLFLQGVFAANAVAMMKVWHFAERASPIQRWAYITPSCMLASWATLLSATFCLIIAAKKTGDLPVALAPLLAAAVTGLGLAVIWVPLVVYPTAPPMVPYAVTLAFGLGAIAANQATQGYTVAAAASLALLTSLLGSALAVTVNFSIAKTKVAAGEDAESTPLVMGARAAVAHAAVSYDRLEAALLGGSESGASLDDGATSGGGGGYGAASARDSTASLHAAAAAAPYRQAAAAAAAARERRGRRSDAPSPPGLPRPKRGDAGTASESEREGRRRSSRHSDANATGGGGSVESSPSKQPAPAEPPPARDDVAVAIPEVPERRDIYAAERKLRDTAESAAAAAAAELRDAQAAAARAQTEWEAARAAAAAAAEEEAAAAQAAAERGAARAATSEAKRERAAAKLVAHAAEAEWREAQEAAAAAAATLQRAAAKAGYARGGDATNSAANGAAKPRRVPGTAPFYRGGAGSSEWRRDEELYASFAGGAAADDVAEGAPGSGDDDDAAAAEEEYRRAAAAAAAAEREWRAARAAAQAAASDSEAAESDAASGRRRDGTRRRL